LKDFLGILLLIVIGYFLVCGAGLAENGGSVNSGTSMTDVAN
jgi:hypothetical protein